MEKESVAFINCFDGYSIPRILKTYGAECFKFTDNFIRMTFPVSAQDTAQVEELVKVLSGEMNRQGIQEKLNLSDREYFRLNYLNPAFGIRNHRKDNSL